MELCEKAVEEIAKTAIETFDYVDQIRGGLEDWRPVFEGAFNCLLSLRDTEALQLFATMCICALDFETYSDLDDIFREHSKEVPMLNTLRYRELNKSVDEQ
jgi:hypothetical protein